MNINLLTLLANVNAIEIDDTFIRHFQFIHDASDDDVMLDAGEGFEFTCSDVRSATFIESKGVWSIHNDSGNEFYITGQNVTPVTRSRIAIKQVFTLPTELRKTNASITVGQSVADSIANLFSESPALTSNACCNSVIDITELDLMDEDQPNADDELSRLELLASELAPVTEYSIGDMLSMLDQIHFLEIRV